MEKIFYTLKRFQKGDNNRERKKTFFTSMLRFSVDLHHLLYNVLQLYSCSKIGTDPARRAVYVL